MRRGTRMVIRGRRLEEERDGLGRGGDVLSLHSEALIERIGRGTPEVSYEGRLGAGWFGHVFVSTNSRMGREGPCCCPESV